MEKKSSKLTNSEGGYIADVVRLVNCRSLRQYLNMSLSNQVETEEPRMKVHLLR